MTRGVIANKHHNLLYLFHFNVSLSLGAIETMPRGYWL